MGSFGVETFPDIIPLFYLEDPLVKLTVGKRFFFRDWRLKQQELYISSLGVENMIIPWILHLLMGKQASASYPPPLSDYLSRTAILSFALFHPSMEFFPLTEH